mgnify:CR=1 FL=1
MACSTFTLYAPAGDEFTFTGAGQYHRDTLQWLLDQGYTIANPNTKPAAPPARTLTVQVDALRVNPAWLAAIRAASGLAGGALMTNIGIMTALGSNVAAVNAVIEEAVSGNPGAGSLANSGLFLGALLGNPAELARLIAAV